MLSPKDAVALSRILVPVLGTLVWGAFYLRAKLAYARLSGWKKYASQIGLVLGAVGVFVLQVELMDRLAPTDARGIYFHAFIFIEVGGGLILGFYALYRESVRSAKRSSGGSSSADQSR